MTGISVDTVYLHALGANMQPYPYQRALAESGQYNVLIAPTGLGKTAAVTLAWVCGRLRRPDDTPRRLVWCLPLRSLVEQTFANASCWMERLRNDFSTAGQLIPEVHTMMGGADNSEWRLHPERPAILIGTQDMLLSRALMRGYGMGRFGWPIDFGLLHTDTLWVFDEVQLMGAGLATSAQLEAFRRIWSTDIGDARAAHSLWMSATLNPEWLRTVDLVKAAPNLRVLKWNVGGTAEPAVLSQCLDGIKRVRAAATQLLSGYGTKGLDNYAGMVACEVLAAHRDGYRTLVIVNRVARAQAIYEALRRAGRRDRMILIHSRFRPADRERIRKHIAGPASDQIVVATQAIEAGIDITSAVLFSELAPWPSLVQRFGRCNRQGELNDAGGAEIRWIDAAVEEASDLALPYMPEDLIAARNIVAGLEYAAPRELPAADRGPQPGHVLRRKDFEELFDTDPDLSGYDIDISPYVRDATDSDVQLFWRAGIDPDPKAAPPPSLSLDQPPHRDEFCRAPIGQITAWLKKPRLRRLAGLCRGPERNGLRVAAARSGTCTDPAGSGDFARCSGGRL